MSLSAVVIGAGWAGEGHTTALRAAGVEVVAMCGRTPEPTAKMAAKLAIPQVRLDWHKALREFKPDIVSIATPAAPHCDMAEAAASMGCHVMCDKPLAPRADEARLMLLSVEQAGVKHAYGTTSRYAPAVVYTRQLIADGFIGQIREIESIFHGSAAAWPYHWVHQLSQGGGLLNNLFTHKLGQVLYSTGSSVQAVMGQARRLVERAPVGPILHDFRQLFTESVDWNQAQTVEWVEVDADTGYTVMLQLRTPDGQTMSALFQASGAAAHPHPDYLAFYGAQGTLVLTGPNAPDHIRHFDTIRQEWRDVPVPQAVIDALPQVEDPVQRDWNQLFREFIADVRGEGNAGYPTFRDGWIAAKIIEIVRSGAHWTALASHPND